MKTVIMLIAAFAILLSARLGENGHDRTDVGVIGGADGPTKIIITQGKNTGETEDGEK